MHNASLEDQAFGVQITDRRPALAFLAFLACMRRPQAAKYLAIGTME